jgi:hypothetical protein
MKVRDPQYGVGVVKSLTEKTAEIAFDDAPRTIAPAPSDLQPAEPTATLSELEMPLANLIRDAAHAVVEALALEQRDVLLEGLLRGAHAARVLVSAARRNDLLRVLEQKVNASDSFAEATACQAD